MVLQNKISWYSKFGNTVVVAPHACEDGKNVDCHDEFCEHALFTSFSL